MTAPAGSNSVGRTTIGSSEGGWWARERARFIVDRLQRSHVEARVVLDLGCGRGNLEPVLADALGAFVVGCDGWRSESWAPRPGRSAHVIADASALPFRAGSADLVVAFDVIEHFDDDQVPLRALVEVARPGAHVALTVPAGEHLWSPYDDAVGHFRRYEDGTLVAACEAAGVQVLEVTHYFAWLVPPAWLMRNRTRHDADEVGEGVVGRAVSAGVGLVGRAERAVVRRRRLRTGTSLWLLGRA